MFQVVIDTEPVEAFGVESKVILCLRLLQDRYIDSKVVSANNAEDMVSNNLFVFSCMELIEEVNVLPREKAAKLHQIASNLTIVHCNRGQREISRAFGGKIEISRFIEKQIAESQSSLLRAQRRDCRFV